MEMEWKKYTGKMINVTMHENYGITSDPNSEKPIYEIVFKTGKLAVAYDDGLLLETERENQPVKIFIPYPSIKCVEIFNL